MIARFSAVFAGLWGLSGYGILDYVNRGDCKGCRRARDGRKTSLLDEATSLDEARRICEASRLRGMVIWDE